MFKVVHKGNFDITIKMLKNAPSKSLASQLQNWGEIGVQALRSATPKDSGVTADSWGYKIVNNKKSIAIVWFNSKDAGGVPLAVLLQYGHGTRNGGYVQGRDYINPALRPIFDEIAIDAWAEITKR